MTPDWARIRQDYAEGASQRSLEKRYGVPRTTLQNRIRREGWSRTEIGPEEEVQKAEQELLDVVTEYRRREVPLDVIVLDWQSWPEGQWGYKTFDEVRFPAPRALIDQLHDMGAKMMISIWPSIPTPSETGSRKIPRGGSSPSIIQPALAASGGRS